MGRNSVGVWGVKNFHAALYRLCEEGSEFTPGYFALVVVAALLATGGLLSNSIPVIIGSMCVAPFLAPSRAVCIGIAYGKWKIATRGLAKETVGLLAIGSTLAFLATKAFQTFAPGITVTTTIIARTFPTLTSLYLAAFVAILSGVSASLALVAEPKIVTLPLQQLLDVMIGTEIAVSLVPPAAVVGIGFAFGEPRTSFQALVLLLINMVSLDFVAVLVLRLRGVEAQLMHLEKMIAEATERIINDTLKADEISVEVTLQGRKQADVLVRLQASENHCDTSTLAEKISVEIGKKAGVSNRVKTIAAPVHVHVYEY
jgi:uncharacterized hydrophobic protein (TIGR00271 family)